MDPQPPAPTGMRVHRDDDGDIQEKQFCPLALGIQEVARTFPSLHWVQSIDPWDVEILASQHIASHSSGTRQAILFLLSIWNPKAPEFYNLEPFDLHYALKIWDVEHRSAFVSWAQNPWWP